MKKKLSALFFIILTVFTLSGCSGGSSEPDITADYDSPRDAIFDHRSGIDITGKTIKVKAVNPLLGVIFSDTDMSLKANVYVTIMPDEKNKDEVNSIEDGETLTVTVTVVDDLLVQSIYIYAREYTLYR